MPGGMFPNSIQFASRINLVKKHVFTIGRPFKKNLEDKPTIYHIVGDQSDFILPFEHPALYCMKMLSIGAGLIAHNGCVRF